MTQSRKTAHSRVTRVSAGLAASALVFAGMITGIQPAIAADGDLQVKDAVFSWAVNPETGSQAYFGGCNFLVAGAVDGSQQKGATVWTDDALYSSKEGNVTITKPNEAGEQVQTSWETRCQAPDGTATTQVKHSQNQANIANGVGTVNPQTNSANIKFSGSFTLVFYGGMTFWSVNDPVLSLENGVGKITARASGYGASMSDMTKWETLEPADIEIATLKNVKVGTDGFTVSPEFAGVETTSTMGNQNRTAQGWGSFPQSWITFNDLTGQSPYWFTSGGAADVRKPVLPITFKYSTAEVEQPETEDPGDYVDVTLPEYSEPQPQPEPASGELKWDWADPSQGEAQTVADLGTAVQKGEYFEASGKLKNVKVTDTRKGGSESYKWTLSAQVSEFTSGDNKFSSSYLGWTPSIVTPVTGVTLGVPVSPTNEATGGLASSRDLAKADAAVSAELGADLKLQVPAKDVAAGSYSAKMTVTTLA